MTPVLLTWNEEANIRRTLESLSWALSVIVLDSGSTDQTEAICREFPNVRFHQRHFDSHSHQWNAAIALAPTEWVLSLDADYQFSPALLKEIKNLTPAPDTSAFSIPFRFAIGGKILRNTILPPRLALFRRVQCHYIQDGHTQDLVVEGRVETLFQPIIHDDRKPFSRWWQSQKKYASLEAEKLFNSKWKELPLQDKLRKLIFPAPFAMATYTLLGQRLLLDGPAGWFYCLQRTLAEALLSAALLRLHLFPKS